MRSKANGWQLHSDKIARQNSSQATAVYRFRQQAMQPAGNQQWPIAESMSFMLYRVSADAVIILHFLFIQFVILGGLLILRNREWIFLHIPAVSAESWDTESFGFCSRTDKHSNLFSSVSDDETKE